MRNEKGFVKYLRDITQDARMVRLFVIMVAAFVIMGAANGHKFLSLSNFQSMARIIPKYEARPFPPRNPMNTGNI